MSSSVLQDHPEQDVRKEWMKCRESGFFFPFHTAVCEHLRFLGFFFPLLCFYILTSFFLLLLLPDTCKHNRQSCVQLEIARIHSLLGNRIYT